MGNIKFNDYIKTFPHEIFGNLTIIKSHHEEDKYWFVGKEVQEVLGFQDLSQAIQKADLESDEFLILEKEKNKQLFDDFIKYYGNEVSLLKRDTSKTPIISKFTPTFTLISESGLFGLTLNSRKPHAKEFKRWVRRVALPTMRKLYAVSNKVTLNHSVELHVSIDVQKEYSWWFNDVAVKEGGAYNAKMSNMDMSLQHTEKRPGYWKKLGKEEAEKRGIPPSKIASGLDGLRLLHPEESCAISLHKNYLERGLSPEEAFRLSSSKEAKNHFKFLIENNVAPHELYGNKKALNEE